MKNENVSFTGEVMLLSWSESNSRGRTIVLQLDEEGDEHPFKKFTVKRGNHAGTRFMAVLVEIGDDEKPVKNAKPMLQSAIRVGASPQFKHFLVSRLGSMPTDPKAADDIAADYIRNFCGVESRGDIDGNAEATHKFGIMMAQYRDFLDTQTT